VEGKLVPQTTKALSSENIVLLSIIPLANTERQPALFALSKPLFAGAVPNPQFFNYEA
jgi:hypothetical protein